MFEFEIMLTGYTVVVASITLAISKFFGSRKIAKIRKELTLTKLKLSNALAEIKQLKTAVQDTKT